MKANELRVGNWVKNEANVFEFDLDCLSQIPELEPIDLTPEWLESFTADTISENEDGSQNYWSRDYDFSIDVETHILVPKLEMLFYYRIDGGLRGRRLSVIHVHQLQNLYFALTGKELELKQ